MREGGGIPVDCAQSNFSSFFLVCTRGRLIQTFKLYIIIENVSMSSSHTFVISGFNAWGLAGLC